MSTYSHLHAIGFHLPNYLNPGYPEAFERTHEVGTAAQEHFREFTKACRQVLAEPVQSTQPPRPPLLTERRSAIQTRLANEAGRRRSGLLPG